MDKAEVFIDGYNLYHGIVDAGLRPWLWVDLCKLAYEVTPRSLEIVRVNYYTAMSKELEGNSKANQRDFITAQNLCNPTGFRLVKGFMQEEDRRCKADCGKRFNRWTEKRTDVNLALDLAFGAANGDFHVAVLISGDADQVTAIERAREAGVDVLAAFPPARHSNHIKNVASKSFVIKDTHLQAAQMSDMVTRADGTAVTRPTSWGDRPGFDGPTGPPMPPIWPS